MARPVHRPRWDTPQSFGSPTHEMGWAQGLRAQVSEPGSHLQPGGMDLGRRTQTRTPGVRQFSPFRSNRNLSHDEFGSVLWQRPERKTVPSTGFTHYSGAKMSVSD